LRREGGRGGFEEGGAGGRKEYTRSDSDNWRTLREEQEDDDGAEPGGSWRIAGSRREGTFLCFFPFYVNIEIIIIIIFFFFFFFFRDLSM